MTRHVLLRTGALLTSAFLSIGAAWLFVDFSTPGGFDGIDFVRTILILVSSFWLAWGSSAGIIGLFTKDVSSAKQDPRRVPKGMTAILVPIYNEDPVATFSRIAAMNVSLKSLGIEDRFHFAILSDTTSLEIAALEVVWFEHLLREPGTNGRIFYRRRSKNTGRKAGNIEDFIVRSGAAYDYALILDADSLMEGATIGEMARRMDADTELGLLQTLPKIINARSFFGRVMQFSSSYFSPYFARGAAEMQGSEGPFWGHNAIVRLSAFAASCGLPELSGRPPYGGYILSHDYVEAALLARTGWKVKLDPHLEGSYEEGPENLIEYAKRDRRWCQGNLQHRRLVFAPGLRIWNRFNFIQGIMAYMASPLWLLLLASSIVAAAMPQRPLGWFAALHPDNAVWALVIGVAMVLILPKYLILVRNALDGENLGFGGTLRAAASITAEIIFSSLLAPIMLMLQSRAVAQVLLGLDGGWPATRREESWLDMRDAFAASWWIVAFGGITLALTLSFSPRIVLWVLPAVVPMIIAPLLIAASSHAKAAGKRPVLMITPTELAVTPVITERNRILHAWTVQPSSEPAITDAPAEIREVVHAKA
jgi:membrane glycosyltransferase